MPQKFSEIDEIFLYILIKFDAIDLIFEIISIVSGLDYLFIDMFMSNIHYFALGMLGIVAIFSLAMGMERMVRMIIGNYILSILCLSLSSTIDLVLQNIIRLQLAKKTSNYVSMYQFLSEYKIIIIIVVYLFGMITLFTKWKTDFSTNHLPFPRFMMMWILVLMTAMSILFTLAVIVWGIGILNPLNITSIVAQYITDPTIL